jgi:hypothetical protein
MENRRIYGVLDPDGVSIHVISFSASHCKDEFARIWVRPGETLESVWEEAKANGFRCIEVSLARKGGNKYKVHKDAIDPWDLLYDAEDGDEA